jgi:hypothetical protein
MENPPVRQENQSGALPERRLSTAEMEAVIRRAVELQAGPSSAGEGVTETEIVRIAQELGLPSQYVQQALAEVRGSGTPDTGLLANTFGEARVVAARVVALDLDRAQRDLERYFRECEHMIVQRRRPGWTVYERANGIAAALGRATQRTPLVKTRTVEVSISAADPGNCYVSLAVDLSGTRAGFAAGTAVAGGGGGATVATVLGLAVAPPAALLGLPLLAGIWWGMRAGYGSIADRTRLRLESILDRLESGELLPPPSGLQATIRSLKF